MFDPSNMADPALPLQHILTAFTITQHLLNSTSLRIHPFFLSFITLKRYQHQDFVLEAKMTCLVIACLSQLGFAEGISPAFCILFRIAGVLQILDAEEAAMSKPPIAS